MRNLSLFILTLFFILSCSSVKTLADYGILDKRNVCSNENYKNGGVIFQMTDFQITFDLNEFKKELDSFENGSLTSLTENIRRKYLMQNETVVIIKSRDKFTVNGSDSVNLDESIVINTALDNLFKEGKFYLKNNNDPCCMDYEHWEPHEQGAITSKWVKNGKIINESNFGFVN